MVPAGRTGARLEALAATIRAAHVIIDGGIDGERLRSALPGFVAAKGEDGLLGPDAIADSYWHLHGQHRTAWTFELDLRPFKEPF